MAITINRWTKYGHDRGYASDADGNQLGYIDLKSGATHLQPGSSPSVELELRKWAAEVGAKTPGGLSHWEEVEYVELPGALKGTDLAWNAAGENPSAKAKEEWDAYSARRPKASKFARFLGLETPDRSWARGAAGEREVGRRLEQLRAEGWFVIHSVPIGNRGSDIDHLLIGPAGVFCINTKNHERGNVWVSEHSIMVNGQKTPYLRNSRYEGERVSKILSKATGWRIEAKPTIIVMAGRYTERSRPRDVWIVGRKQTPQAFRRLPAIYSFEAVETIFRAARDSATWK